MRKPCLILKRVTGPKTKVCTQSDTYWLDSETKGSLKLTTKKQSIAESLKLTLKKKSSESSNFTVVHSNFNLVKNHQQRDMAVAKENNRRDDKPTEKSINEPFENVMMDQQVSSLDSVIVKLQFSVFSTVILFIGDDYENIKSNTKEHDNPLEENERLSIDINEADSDVENDMANPSQQEDQNVDDIQTTDNYDNSEKRLRKNRMLWK